MCVHELDLRTDTDGKMSVNYDMSPVQTTLFCFVGYDYAILTPKILSCCEQEARQTRAVTVLYFSLPR